MAAKRFRLIVKKLGATAPLSDAPVEGDNWMDALRRGRATLGEAGGVPTGASCAVAPNGTVTIHDPLGQKTYLLMPDGTPLPQSSPPPAAAAPAPAPAEAAPPRRSLKRTMAYAPEDVSAALSKVAAVTGQAPVVASAPKPAVVAVAPAPTPVAKAITPEPKRAPAKTAPTWKLLRARDEDPRDDNPLTYRERAYVIDEAVEDAAAETFLRGRLDAVRNEIESATGRFVNLAVFDHRWENRPERPAIATLQWKDWRNETTVAFPRREQSQRAAAAAVAVPMPRTADHDPRLVTAFEACQDLLFLATPLEGVDFAVRLLSELVPCEAAVGCLYDLNTDELRIVAASGAAEHRKGTAMPSTKGLFGVAARTEGVPYRVSDVRADARFDPAVDGYSGVDVRSLLYMALHREGNILGALQLANRLGDIGFTDADADVVTYVCGQLATYLGTSRVSLRP